VSWFRRKRSLNERVTKRGRELRDAATHPELKWARSAPARAVREGFLRVVLAPAMRFYLRRRATGREGLDAVKGPVILVANHSSHVDTPVILAALPRRLRKRTAVAAAADRFYRSRLTAAFVSLIFNTVPIDRNGGGMGRETTGNLDKLLDQGWNLLVYPEGTRSRTGGGGRIRRGAAVLATRHNLPVVPIRISGTSKALPVGRLWPRRLRKRVLSKRHDIDISFGDPIQPTEDPNVLQDLVQKFFEAGADAIVTSTTNGTKGTNGHANGTPAPPDKKRLLRRS
jgi:1-acyl-sn-glycerol-3-phosphate acyltransferase